MTQHKADVHPGGEMMNYCSICKKQFSSKQQWENHMFVRHQLNLSLRQVLQVSMPSEIVPAGQYALLDRSSRSVCPLRQVLQVCPLRQVLLVSMPSQIGRPDQQVLPQTGNTGHYALSYIGSTCEQNQLVICQLVCPLRQVLQFNMTSQIGPTVHYKLLQIVPLLDRSYMSICPLSDRSFRSICPLLDMSYRSICPLLDRSYRSICPL